MRSEFEIPEIMLPEIMFPDLMRIPLNPVFSKSMQ